MGGDPINISDVRNTKTDITYDKGAETFRDFVLMQADANHDGIIRAGNEADEVADVLQGFESGLVSSYAGGYKIDGSLSAREMFMSSAITMNQLHAESIAAQEKYEIAKHNTDRYQGDFELNKCKIMKLLNLESYNEIDSIRVGELDASIQEQLAPLLAFSATNAQLIIAEREAFGELKAVLSKLEDAVNTCEKAQKFAIE